MPKRKSSGSQQTTASNQQESSVYHPIDNNGVQPNLQGHGFMVSHGGETNEYARIDNSEPGSSAKRARHSDGSVVEVLSGITRKITACAACRKNKVVPDVPFPIGKNSF